MVSIPERGRGILIAILILIMVIGSADAASEPANPSNPARAALAIPAQLPGDINGDGQISAVDALLALQMTIGKVPQAAVADMDGDGVVRVNDVLLILQTSATSGLAVERGMVVNPATTVDNTVPPVPRNTIPSLETGSPTPAENRLVTSSTPKVVITPDLPSTAAILPAPAIVTTTPSPTPTHTVATPSVVIPREIVATTTTEIPVMMVTKPVVTLDPCIVSGGTRCPSAASTGTCTYLSQDLQNCGSCGHPCTQGANGEATCTSGVCGIVCNTGYGNCDAALENGCETNLMTSEASCGACGSPCTGGQCVSGKCVVPVMKTVPVRRL
jgi:Dockerin type I domain